MATVKSTQELAAPELLLTIEPPDYAGLSSAEVQDRHNKFGYNEIPPRKTYPLLRFLKKFWGLSAWMLEMILILSIILHHNTDIYIVSALLLANAILSYFQEQRASAAVNMLRSRLQVNARVRRDGEWTQLPARELVPGDLVRIRTGDFVPADTRLIDGHLEVDQSSLTGESHDVARSVAETLYSGTIVRRGEASCVVQAIGVKTYYGRTTELVQIARPKLHAEEVVSKVVRWLFIIVGVLLAVAVVFIVVRGIPIVDILPLLLVILLGAVPVALPVMFTVSMAVASQRLAHKGVLVTRLSASDDASTMDVLCVDKTGTITLNRLAVTSAVPLAGAQEPDVVLYGALASQEANQDPIDMAFINAARERGLPLQQFKVKTFQPFDASTRLTEASLQHDGQELHVLKGAVATVANRCGFSAEDKASLEQRTAALAQNGQRVLAVAASADGTVYKLTGLVTLSDQPRPDSAKLIAQLADLGVAVKMLTGDALPIAREVAASVGLGGNIHQASELQELAKKDPAAAARLAEQSDGFAGIYPEGKYQVVGSLQSGGHVVGMTGDGVNDAPALRQAEVGIAVSSASDVAKGAASVVLLDEGLADIVNLVTEGRMVYQRIATWIINKISRTILKSVFVVFAFIITGQFIISPFSMILQLFMTDFVKISIATDNARWSQKPETWNIPALTKVAAVMGILMTVEAFGLLWIGYRWFGIGSNVQLLYTFSFGILLYNALFSIFAVRERRHFWDSRPSATMLWANGIDVVVGAVIMTVGIPGLAPLPISATLFIIGYSLLFSLVINDLAKWLVIRKTGINW
ncbi:MAG: plasma-membrane proton-efflux P-type ATPase [Anaerolineae bacterium]